MLTWHSGVASNVNFISITRPRENAVDPAAGRQIIRLNVVAFGRREMALPPQRAGREDAFGRFSGKAGHSAVAQQVRVDRVPKRRVVSFVIHEWTTFWFRGMPSLPSQEA
jgi:hypothetical protein